MIYPNFQYPNLGYYDIIELIKATAQVVEPLGQNTALNSQSFQVFNTG